MDALAAVEVTVNDVGASGFQLTFSIDKQSPLQILFLLTGGRAAAVHAGDRGRDGQRRRQRADRRRHHEQRDRARRQGLELDADDDRRGSDRADGSVELERIPVSRPARARPASRCCSPSTRFSACVPLIIPSIMIDVPMPIERIPGQQGTDLRIHPLRWPTQVGYVFYLDPGPVPGIEQGLLGAADQGWPGAAGTERRHGRLHQRGEPAFHASTRRRTDPDRLSSTSRKPGSPSRSRSRRSLRSNPPLGAIPPLPTNILRPICKPFRDDLSKLPDPAGHHDRDGCSRARTPRPSRARAASTSTRYGRVLRPGKLVGVRGSGPAFDGLYYVKSVTHKIKRGEYKQNFTLTRNGLVSTVPTVKP